jgi:hypothetical protein
VDWSKADPELVKEIVRESELFLQGQLTLATSADQRASSLAAVFAASGTAIIAGLISAPIWQQGASDPPLIVAGIVAAALFLVGASFCVLTTMPVGFDLPGSRPESWEDDVQAGRLLPDVLPEQVENYQGKIADNSAVLKRNAVYFRIGAIAGLASPFAGFCAWALVMSCRWLS